jgi:hypothetical protein
MRLFPVYQSGADGLVNAAGSRQYNFTRVMFTDAHPGRSRAEHQGAGHDFCHSESSDKLHREGKRDLPTLFG